MDESQIKQSLEDYFKRNRLVMWYDDNAEFADTLPQIDGVEIINMKDVPHFKIRVMIDIEQPEQKFLLYAPYARPTDIKKDWFIDVAKYAPVFRADKSSVILNNLGLACRQDLLSYFSDKLKFFKSNARFEKFKTMLNSNDDVQDMDLKIISILTKSDKADIFSVIISLLCSWVGEDGTINLDKTPAMYDDIVKMGMEQAFFKLLGIHFGYITETPTLKDFVLRLFASDVMSQLNTDKYPVAIKALKLPKIYNAFICLNEWRESNRFFAKYDDFSAAIADELQAENWLSGLDLDDLMNVQTFLRVEHRIIVELRERVLHSIEITDNKDIIAYVKKRQDCHWASNMLKDTAVARTVYNRLYEAILNVSNMVVATNSLQALANIEDFDALYNLYTKELYKIDTLYRHSIEAIQFVQSKGIEVLKPLLQFAEDTYNNKYIETLGVKINRTINFALAQGWKVRDAHNLYDFFTRFVKTPVENEKRVFVIISDGLRYEVASELAAQINSQYRMKAELDSMLGVLPSYTALGMAALLPHSTLDYNEKGEVLIDDKPTMSLEQRKVFLDPYKGTAIKMEDFLNMGREEGRNFIKPYNLIYIYHNQIDATGDAAKTEENTFVAVTDTITKMNDLIVHLINNLSANHILLTSDHGFLFQYSKPDATDRSVDEEDFSGAIIFKKRYVIGYDLPKSANSIQYNTKVTAKTEKETEFSLPKGASLYNFIGGSRFVHGGAMPQEFIVPMLQIRQIKDEKKKETTRTKEVEVTLLGNTQRFTNKIQRFQLMQTEPVSNRNKPVTLKIGVYEEEEPVTNIETVTFDSRSDKIEDWKKIITLTLKNRTYSRGKQYSLRLVKENNVVAQDVNIKIDLVYDDEF